MSHESKKCSKKCVSDIKLNVPYQPLTLIQNVPQNIDANGQLINFNIFNKTKFARLLDDKHSIKIRKNGAYQLNVSGTVKWVLNQEVTLSFALLKNGVALADTIQNKTLPAGVYSFDENVTKMFNLKRGDILSFEVESSVASTTFVPTILQNSMLVSGNGLTLSIQSLQSQSVAPTSVSSGKYTVYIGFYGNDKGIRVLDKDTDIATFVYIENLSVVEEFVNDDNNNPITPTYVIGWGGYSNENNDDHYVTVMNLEKGFQTLQVTCVEPYMLASLVFGNQN